MAVDITTIGIEYDTSGLEKGTRAQDKTRDSANKLGDSVDRTEKSFSSLNKILGIAAGALAAVGGVMLAKQFTETADAVSLMDARLKMATGSLQDFKQAQKDIYAISQANNVGIKETTSLYTKLSDPVRRLGGTSKEVAAIVESFATSLRVGGANAQEASAATLQFAQAMGSGKLSGDEFNSIAEASPRFMKALAEGMRRPIEELKALGSEGKLTADVVGNSLVKSLDQLKKEAAGLPDTVSGAITRFKNDVILAVGEISNSQGFTVGFAGLIEQARGLIPVIKDEVLGAFVAVNGWIERNKEEIGKVWTVAKGIVGDVWEVAKGAFSVAGFIVEWATQSGLVKTTFETIRLLIAGFQDGVTAIGAGFAYVGSQIFQMVLMPLQKVLETTAKVAGVFDDQMAANLRAVAKEIDDFAKGGENYARSVADAFGNGESAVGRLNAELGRSQESTKEVGKAAAAAGGDFKALKSTVTDAGKESKKLSIEQQAAQSIREQSHKREIELMKSIDKEMTSYAKDQIDRSKEVTKEIISGINDQARNYLAVNKAMDTHAQRMEDTNELAKLEIELLGMSSVERNTLIEQKKIQLALDRDLQKIREMSLSAEARQILVDKATAQANIDKSTAELRAQQTEWSKFYGEIYNGLSDSLYRGFEAGKGFGKSFLDSIKNLFKTNVIKIGVQAIMGGGLGLSGAASAASSVGSAGSAVSGISGLMSTISGLSSAIGSIGTSAGVFGSTGFMASLAGGLQGAGVGSGLTSALGLQIGNTVSSVLGTTVSSAISSGVSAVSGVLAAVPVWGWAALAGGALLSKFGGGGDRVTGQQSISGMLGGTISRDVPFTKSGGLLGKSDAGVWNYDLATSTAIASNGRAYTDTASQASDTALLQTLNSNYAALQEAAKGYASVLGLSVDAVTSISDRINFNLGKTKEETDAAMQAAFGQIANDITNRLAPSIAIFGKEGEQASATLARLAGSLVSVNQVMATFGMEQFSQTLEGGNAAARLAELSGGIEKLGVGAQYFYENFLTDAEKIKPVADQVSATMARLGLSNVKTVEDFKLAIKGGEDSSGNFIKGLDLTTESGAKMYAELIAIAPQFKAVADYMGQATLAIEDNSAALKRAQEVADERKALQEELNAYQQQYNELTLTSAELLKMQKDALDESNKGIFDDIQALKLKVNAKLQADAAEIESAKAVAKEAEKIATQREGLQSRYNALQDEYNSITLKSAELLRLQKSAINSSNIDLFDSIQLIQEKIVAEKALAAEKKAIEDQGIALQEELNNLKMTEADRSAKQAAGIAQVNRDIYDQIIALKAKNKADEDSIKLAEKIRDQEQTLQDELDRLTMNEEQLYEKRKATYYESNQDLFDQIEQIKKLQASELKAKDEYLAKIAEQKRISDAIDAERVTLQDEYNQLTMTEIQLMELKKATLNESNRDLFDLIQAEKLRRAEQSKIEESAKAAQSEYAQAMQSAADSLKSYLNDIVSEFGSLAKSLRDFSRGLTVGETSRISPEDRYKLLGSEVNALLPKVQSGDKKALSEWTKISEEYLKSSQDYNATNLQYFKDLEFIKQHTDAAAIYAQSQVDVAQLQLDLMGDQLGALDTLNKSVQDVVSAINGQASTSASSSGGSVSASSSMSLVQGYKGNVLQNLEGYGGLESLYSGATTGNTDAYKTLKKQMERWAMMGLDKNALDQILGAGWYEKLKAIPGFKNGGLASGLAMVGENGAELVNFKSPARVYNSNDTKSILGGNSESSKETNDLLKKQNALMEKLISKLEGASEKQIKAVGNVAQKIGVANANVKFEKAGT